MWYVLIALSAYLIGAMPFAFLIVKLLTGQDLRRLGTGNVGVMNSVRQAGLPADMLAFLGEGLKGIMALGVARVIHPTAEAYAVAGTFALVGVNWSAFMGFHGGRGTTIAVFLALALVWPVVPILGLMWLALYRIRHDNFFATRINIVLLPFITAMVLWVTDGPWPYLTFAVAGSLITLYRHRRETDDHYIAVHERARVH